MEQIKAAIRAKALELGFDAVGFASAAGDPARRAALLDYLAEGRHGDMAWMADRAEQRADPQVLWPEACSIVALGVNYAPFGDPLALLDRPERGNISVYARNKDYHDLIKKRLKQLGRWMAETYGCQLKVFVDTAPVMEKPLAAQAGLGWQGKHTNLVSRHFGSWLFLSAIYTSLDLAPDAPHRDFCGSCRSCHDACPTDAFTAEGRIDPRRCISYLTIETKEPIPRELRARMGNRIYGCDDCLSACPWNKFATPAREADFLPRIELTAPRLADLARLNDADFRQVFTASPVKRIGRERFVRNVLIAIGNSGEPRLAEVAHELLNDESPVVRGMAVWALERLLERQAFAELRTRYLPREADDGVCREWG